MLRVRGRLLTTSHTGLSTNLDIHGGNYKKEGRKGLSSLPPRIQSTITSSRDRELQGAVATERMTFQDVPSRIPGTLATIPTVGESHTTRLAINDGIVALKRETTDGTTHMPPSLCSIYLANNCKFEQ
jgi:hypothetical protein